MAYYPDPNQPQAAHPAQQPWPAGAQPQNLYGNTPVPSMPSGSPAYPAAFPQAWQAGQQPARNYRPLLLALLAFPFTALKMFVWPGPATFAKEKDRVGGGTVLFLLLVGGALTGLFAYLWGRLSRLAPGIENLSAGRVVPQPLSTGICVALAVGVPFLFLLLESLLYWVAKKQGGKLSSVRAQLYTGLLIEAPLYVLVVALAFVLLSRPDLASSSRLIFAVVAGAFLLYSLLLHVFAVMAVHQMGAGKAMLCVALTVVALAAVVVALMALGESSSDSQSGGSGHSHASGGNQASGGGEGSRSAGAYEWFGGDSERSRQAPARGTRLRCPNCGLMVPAALGQPGMACPRCGTPMMDYR